MAGRIGPPHPSRDPLPPQNGIAPRDRHWGQPTEPCGGPQPPPAIWYQLQFHPRCLFPTQQQTERFAGPGAAGPPLAFQVGPETFPAIDGLGGEGLGSLLL